MLTKIILAAAIVVPGYSTDQHVMELAKSYERLMAACYMAGYKLAKAEDDPSYPRHKIKEFSEEAKKICSPQ